MIRNAPCFVIVTALLATMQPLVCQAQFSQQPHPSVCRVTVSERGGSAFGSGTLIDQRDGFGLVVTNWHVVRDAAGPIEVRFPGGYQSQARPVKLDETWDLAALVIWAPGLKPVPLASTAPRPGEPLTICGYGQGEYRAARGRCTDYYAPEVGKPRELVELSVEARQGDSGGPILNDRGELAGVLFGAGRGTTLGSFGGRVNQFLASVAPDIGLERSVQVAETNNGPRAQLMRPEIPQPVEPSKPSVAVAQDLKPVKPEYLASEQPKQVAQALPPAPAVKTAVHAKAVCVRTHGRSELPLASVDLRSDFQVVLMILGLAAVAVHVARLGAESSPD